MNTLDLNGGLIEHKISMTIEGATITGEWHNGYLSLEILNAGRRYTMMSYTINQSNNIWFNNTLKDMADPNEIAGPNCRKTLKEVQQIVVNEMMRRKVEEAIKEVE